MFTEKYYGKEYGIIPPELYPCCCHHCLVKTWGQARIIRMQNHNNLLELTPAQLTGFPTSANSLTLIKTIVGTQHLRIFKVSILSDTVSHFFLSPARSPLSAFVSRLMNLQRRLLIVHFSVVFRTSSSIKSTLHRIDTPLAQHSISIDSSTRQVRAYSIAESFDQVETHLARKSTFISPTIRRGQALSIKPTVHQPEARLVQHLKFTSSLIWRIQASATKFTFHQIESPLAQHSASINSLLRRIQASFTKSAFQRSESHLTQQSISIKSSICQVQAPFIKPTFPNIETRFSQHLTSTNSTICQKQARVPQKTSSLNSIVSQIEALLASQNKNMTITLPSFSGRQKAAKASLEADANEADAANEELRAVPYSDVTEQTPPMTGESPATLRGQRVSPRSAFLHISNDTASPRANCSTPP